jgi:hypothetical protein
MTKKQRTTNSKRCNFRFTKVRRAQMGRKEYQSSPDRAERKGGKVQWLNSCFRGGECQARGRAQRAIE